MKIVMVGGGSCNWSPKLICDMIHEDWIDGSEIVIEDINLDAARKIRAAGERLARDNGRKLKFTVTDNEEKAFRGADIVLITISTGGLSTMTPDVHIPEKYGIFQCIGDTVGPGGWSRALRNVPVFAKWAVKFRKLCPNAFILNYSNPMACLTGVFHAVAPELKVIGLCHGAVGTIHYIANLFGVDPDRISAKIGGINHFFWILDFTVDGENGYELLKKKLAGRPLFHLDKSFDPRHGIFEINHRVLSAIYDNFGYLTYSADDHTSEFLPGFLMSRKAVRDYRIFHKSMQDRADTIAKNWKEVDNIISGKQKIFDRSIEIAVEVMKAIRFGTHHVDIVNLPNEGQIDNLPRHAVVETYGTVSASGFCPTAVGKLPPALLGLTLPHCNIQLMTLEAALTGNKQLALEALMLDPLCHKLTFAETRQMAEELMAANRKYLPQFN